MADTQNSGTTGNASAAGYMHLYTVSEVCSLLNITRKTLFYYDRIGLAAPTARLGPQSHKVYDSDALEKLKTIAAYREAGLAIEEIRILKEAEGAERKAVFAGAKERLNEEKRALETKLTKLEALMEKEAF